MDAKTLEIIKQKDKASWMHPFTSIGGHLQGIPHVIESAEGTMLIDAEGRKYLDGMAGLWCVNVGYGRTELIEAMTEQVRKLPYYQSFVSFSNEPSALLADRLCRMAPGEMSKAFFTNSGSEANESIIKTIWYYNNLRGKPQKKKLIARNMAYHGVTLGSASLSGIPRLHEMFDLPLDRFLHVTKPHFYREAQPGEDELAFSARLAEELDQLIVREGPETVGAFFAEPVMAAGGVLPPPEGYFEAIGKVLKKHDVLFVADEVVCGFGRLGATFGSTKYNITPDFMTLAKGISSTYFPIAAFLVSESIWSVLREHSDEATLFNHGHTTSAHPVGAAVAMANLDIVERENLVERAAEIGSYLHTKLHEAFSEHPLVGEVRGTGLIAAVELVENKEKKTLFSC